LLLIIRYFYILKIFSIAFNINRLKVNCKKELLRIFAIFCSFYFLS